MFGRALLVNPVVTPGATSRQVYLPAGRDWYDFWTGRRTAGGQTVDAPAPIDTLPLFVKAGSILPLGPVVQYAGEKPAAPLELRVYRGADGVLSRSTRTTATRTTTKRATTRKFASHGTKPRRS